jgi:hypothetical protein
MNTANPNKQIQELNGHVEPGISEWFGPIVLAVTLAGLILTMTLPLVSEK